MTALETAADADIEIVPATGRFYRGMPETIQKIPFVHYAITMNGAQVKDIVRGITIYASEIPIQDALAILSYLDTFPVIYDCYAGSWGYMSTDMWESAPDYIASVHTLQAIKKYRTPIQNLPLFLLKQFRTVQKIQLYTKDVGLWSQLLRAIPAQFPQLSVSSSLPNNIEINSSQADKGIALQTLMRYLGLTAAQTMAFGDGLNDLRMLRIAGVGVAMGNAHPYLALCAVLLMQSDGLTTAMRSYAFKVQFYNLQFMQCRLHQTSLRGECHSQVCMYHPLH